MSKLPKAIATNYYHGEYHWINFQYSYLQGKAAKIYDGFIKPKDANWDNQMSFPCFITTICSKNLSIGTTHVLNHLI